MTFIPSPEQQAIFDFVTSSRGNLAIEALAGCLAGETTININRAGKGGAIRIDHLVSQLNGQPPLFTRTLNGRAVTQRMRSFDLSIPTYVARADDETVRLARLKSAWFSGEKFTYTVTTDSGRSIRATDIHPFLTENGWVMLGGLRVGMSVKVNVGRSEGKAAPKIPYKLVTTRFHPNQSKSTTGGIVYFRVPEHRLVVKAKINGLSLNQLLDILRNDEVTASGLTYLKRSDLVHHIDRNSLNNTRSNLEVVSRKEHAQHHDWGKNVLWQVGVERIVSITPHGVEPTYDIEVEDEPHNFLANGFVVHNTGKTTTLIELAKRLPPGKPILFCAFNKDIVLELEDRLKGTGVSTRTFHALGRAALFKHLNVKGQLEPDGDKYRKIVLAWAETNLDLQTALAELAVAAKCETKDLFRDTVSMAVGLLSMLRYKLAEWTDTERLAQLIVEYGLDEDIYGDETIVRLVLAEIPVFMAEAEKQVRNLLIDFTDMIYWVVRWDLKMYQHVYVMVDEAQDLSPMQRAMVRKALWPNGGRIFIVGDKFQAIYAFAGADSDSFDLSVAMFNATVLPLTTTRRCAQIVTQHAAQIVPTFNCPADKPRGEIVWIDEGRMVGSAQPGDYILCRKKAPLVAGVLEFIAAGIPATILGADIAKALIRILEKLQKRDDYVFEKLLDVLQAYETAQVERHMKKNDEAGAEAVRDHCAALRVVIENVKAPDYDTLVRRIEALFSEQADGRKLVTFSTIHKSKGLEAERVFILKPDCLPLFFPTMSAEAMEQENHLNYVARTRAKKTLVYLTNDKFLKNRTMPRYAQAGFDGVPLEASVRLAPPEELPPPAAQLPEPPPKLLDEPRPEMPPSPSQESSRILAALRNASREFDEELFEPDGTDIYMVENQLGFGQDGDYLDWILKSKTVEIAPIVAPQQKLLALVESLSVSEIDRLMTLLTEVRSQKAAAS